MATRNTLNQFFQAFGRAKRYSHLFAMSDRELATRGFDRDGLTKAYIAELSGR